MNLQANQFGWNLRRAVLALALAALAFQCRTGGEERPDEYQPLAARQELAEIRKLYEPPACYYATFSVQSQVPGQRRQEARGVIRADNARRKMLMIFQDPFIGITLSRLVINESLVYVSNPQSPVQTIPLDMFQVRGMGYNSIALPFPLFQDLLYARLPDGVFSENARLNQSGRDMTVQLQKGPERYVYGFEARRLRSVEYTVAGQDFVVQAKLEGQYRATSFPATIRLESAPVGSPPEILQIRFLSIDPNASCRDAHFTPR